MWGLFSNNNYIDVIKDKIRDLERELRSVEYDFNRAMDEHDRAEKNGDYSSERRWDDIAYRLKCKKEDIEYDIRDLEREL